MTYPHRHEYAQWFVPPAAYFQGEPGYFKFYDRPGMWLEFADIKIYKENPYGYVRPCGRMAFKGWCIQR